MFEPKKKIRQINQALDNAEKSPEMEKLVHAIHSNKPGQANSQFEQTLKAKLLAKHQSMTKNAPKKVEHEEKGFSLWSDFRARGWAMALGVLALVVLAGIVSYPLIPAPTVQGYVLKNSVREISVNAPIKVTFSQLMDNSSVEKNFMVEPAMTGKFSWTGNTLNFTPDNPRKIGDTYKVSIGKGAQSWLRKPLAGEYSEYYKMIKTPEVTLLTPNDTSNEIPADTKINIMFDRPMVEFTTLEMGETQFPPIKIEPALKGKFKWLGTSTLQFIPEKLALGTTYKVTVPAGISAVDGGTTEKEFVSSFDTTRPMMTGFVATDAMEMTFSPNSQIKLTFNQKIDLSSAQQLISLDQVGKAQAVNVPVDIRYFTAQDYQDENKRAGELFEMSQVDTIKEEAAPANTTPPANEIPAKAELEKNLIITPKAPLAWATQYNLKIKAGLKGVEGPLGVTVDIDNSFSVINQFAYLSTNTVDPYNGNQIQNVAVNFNAPVDLRSFKGKVHITPVSKDAEGKEIEPVLSKYDEKTVWINYPYKPSTKYTIAVDSGLKDIFGDVYNGNPVSYQFGNPALDPEFNLKSGSDLTMVDGSKPSVFYVNSVNIPNLTVKLKKLSEQEFLSFYDQGYVNDNVRTYPDDQFTQNYLVPTKFALNEHGFTQLDLDKLSGAKLEPGFYFLRVMNDQVKDLDGAVMKANQIIVVSKSALAIKYSVKQMMVWATDTAEGKPVPGMKLRITSKTGDSLTGETDANGLARIDLPDTKGDYYKDWTVIGEKDGDLAFVHSSWSEGVAPWNFNINSEAFSPEYYTYIYTDRPVYRPAQEVDFKGIIRRDTDKGFKLPNINKVKVEILDPNGNSIFDKELPINGNGTFNGSLQLGENITTGDYALRTTLMGAEGPDWANLFYNNFKVYEYRKPEYKLDMTPEKTDYINGETAKIKVNAGYFFGAPLPNTDVSWTVKSSDYYFILPEELVAKLNGSWFSFAEDGFFCYWGCQSGSEIVSSGNGKTDAQGNYEISLPLQIGDKKMSQLYTVEANVSDANNQSVSNRVSLNVHKGDTYVGIRSTDYIIESGKPAKFEVLTVKPSGEIVKGANVEVALYKREWNTVKRKNVDSDYYYENNYQDTLVEKKNVSSGDNGLAQAEFTVKDGGSFKVEATLKDSHGNEVKSSTTVYAGSSEFVNWGSENNDKLELVTDKTEYKVGDTAKILVKSPYRGVYALVTSEKDRVFDQKVIKLDSNSQTIEVPVTEKFLPNAFVSVVLVKGDRYDAGLKEPVAGANDERQVASFKVGYATIQVNTADKKMNIGIKSDKAVYGPKEHVKLNLTTTDSAGRPVPAELSVGVVDESVLSLTESVTADLLNVFYRERLLGVSFAHTLTKAISRINVQVEAGMKGGGGGEMAKRGLFKDTAYFAAVVNTDAQGNGTVEFDLPDNLTTWQVMAIGITNDKAGSEKTLVGSNKYDFLVNKDILVRPVLSRFLTSGDEMIVSAIVHNYTDQNQTASIQLAATGVDILDGATRSAVIKSKSSEKVDWKIKVGDASAGNAKFDFKAVAGDKGDEIEQSLPIHQPSFPSFAATNKVVSGDAKEVDQVWMPMGLDLSRGKLTITMNATLAGTINKGLEYLMTYPYGCSEQLASSIIPNLALKHLIDLKKFDTKAIDQIQLKKNVESGLQAIYKNQHPNGGFGLWLESQDNEWVSAYVLYTFYLADQNGYNVDKNVMAMTTDYLNKSIRSNAMDGEDKAFVANLRAYVLFVLSEVKQGDLGLLNNLYGQKDLLGLTSKTYLAMAYQNMIDQKKAGSDNAVANKIKELQKNLENAAQQTERGVTFSEDRLDYRLFETNTSTTALVLKALNRIDASNPLIPKILQALLREKQAGHYATTQETAVSLLAMIEYLEKSKELSPAFDGVITVNGKDALKKSYTSANLFENNEVQISLKDLLPNNLDNEVTSQKTGQGKMYVDMNLEYYLPLDQLKARNEGIEVTQEYFAQDDTKMEHPLSEAKVGQNMKAKMTVIVPEDRDYVMVEDYLPAGLEGIDFNLKTSEQNLQDEGKGGGKGECYDYDCYNNWYFIHSEVRDDRVMYWADYLPKGVYEIEYYVRPTSVGNFADLPAMAQETYFPEVFGRSEGKMFKVNP